MSCLLAVVIFKIIEPTAVKARILFFSVISTRIRRVLAISLLRVVFDAWHSVAVDARKTKEYFEVRELATAAKTQQFKEKCLIVTIILYSS